VIDQPPARSPSGANTRGLSANDAAAAPGGQREADASKEGLQMTIVVALARSMVLLLTGRVRFPRAEIGRLLTMEDGKQFTVFRHAKVGARGEPTGVFIVRFTPAHMSVRQNIRFSLLPMIPLLGMRGFREKYWCVNEQTGECQGVYAWQTLADAEAYAHSIALRFMSGRSLPGSVSNQIHDQSQQPYWVFRHEE
jgi:hypothetical protein